VAPKAPAGGGQAGGGASPPNSATVECTENRWSQAYGKDYSYGGLTNSAKPMALHPLLRAPAPGSRKAGGGGAENLVEMCRALAPEFAPFDLALANWYGPLDSIAAHSDDEPQIEARSPIFSFSWGATRKFTIKPKANPAARAPPPPLEANPTNPTKASASGGAVGEQPIGGGDLKGDQRRGHGSAAPDIGFRVSFDLRDGDLLIMGGRCQETHKHELPAPKRRPVVPACNEIARPAELKADRSGDGVSLSESTGQTSGCCPAAGRRVNLTIRSSTKEKKLA